MKAAIKNLQTGEVEVLDVGGRPVALDGPSKIKLYANSDEIAEANRQGNDLVVKAIDGSTLVFQDYYGPSPSGLTSELLLVDDETSSSLLGVFLGSLAVGAVAASGGSSGESERVQTSPDPANSPLSVDRQTLELSFVDLKDNGASAADGITRDNTFDLSLNGQQAGSTVVYEVSTDGGTTWTPTTAVQFGVPVGSYQYRAQASDAVGSTATSNVISVTVEAAATGGTGDFNTGTQIDTLLDSGAFHTSLGDLDGDGDLDLITSATASSAFVVFENDDTGSFESGSQIDTILDRGASHTSLGDLDGDGDLDLITAASSSNAFVVFKNDGAGVFDEGTQIDTILDHGAVHTSLGDLDGDGDLDLITTANGSDAFVIFKNDGTGGFDAGTQISTSLDDYAIHTSLGDLDGDGDLDLITAASNSNAFVVFKNSGDGTFDAGVQINTSLDSVARHTSLGDLDGDGHLDLITAANNSDAFVVFKNDGSGTFDTGTQINTSLDDFSTHSTLGDWDGDGDLDLITSALFSDAFGVFENDGTGSFGESSQIETILDDGAVHTSLGDLDGDGDLDLITSSVLSDAFQVFFNNDAV